MSTPPLPILAISVDAYRILFRNYGVYLRLSWLPFLILFVASTGMQFFYRDVAGFGEEGNVLIGGFGQVFEISLWLVTIPIATAWTRLVILESAAPAQLRVGRAEAVYLLRYVYISVLAFGTFALVAVMVGLIAELTDGFGLDDMDPEASGSSFTIMLAAIFVPAFAFSLFVLSRFLLAFPAAAIGNPSRLRDAFALTKGRMGAVFAILLMTFGPELLAALDYALWGSEMEYGPSDGFASAALVALEYYAVSWLFFPVSIGALALVYRHLGGTGESPGAAVPRA